MSEKKAEKPTDNKNAQGGGNYKAEMMESLLSFAGEAANYVAVIVTAIVTASLSIFMDLINSTCNLLRAGFCSFLSMRLQKNLKYKYNYGTGKLETLSMLFCDALLIIGTGAVMCFGIYQLFVPKEVSDTMLFGVLFKLCCCLLDLVIVFVNIRVYRKSKSKIAKVSLAAVIGNFSFDFAVFISVTLAFILRNKWAGVVYVEPVFSILISIVIIYASVKRIKGYVKELVDLTLSEEDQLKITKLLSRHFDKYENFYSVNSRKNGEVVCIDFRLSFTDETTFAEIKEALALFTKDLEQMFEKVSVSFIIDEQTVPKAEEEPAAEVTAEQQA